jgi:50S ribosomal protein L16 3-hydroxylase
VPAALQDFAVHAVHAALSDPQAVACALGELLSEPKARVWFDAPARRPRISRGVQLDRRTRMLYDAQHVFINGESFRAGGVDARLLRELADQRGLGATELLRLSAQARETVDDWVAAGWLQEA